MLSTCSDIFSQYNGGETVGNGGEVNHWYELKRSILRCFRKKFGFPRKWFRSSVPWHSRERTLMTWGWSWQWPLERQDGDGWVMWGAVRAEVRAPVFPRVPSDTWPDSTWPQVAPDCQTHSHRFLYWKRASVIMRTWDGCFTCWSNTPLFINSWLSVRDTSGSVYIFRSSYL